MAARTSPRGPEALTEACSTRFMRQYRTWIAIPETGEQDVVGISTAPPGAAHAAENPDETAAWIRRWREFDADVEELETVEVTWARRRLPGFGTVDLPQRAEVRGDVTIARLATLTDRWTKLRERTSRLVELGPDHRALRSVAANTVTHWEKLSDEDMDRLLSVCRWVLDNSTAGLTAREIPIPGVDTKWIETRLRVIEHVVDAARQGRPAPGDHAGLALRARDLRIRIRLLDDSIAFPLRDVESPARELAELWPDRPEADGKVPDRVVVVENLTTFLALPPLPGTVAIFGRGFAVDAVAALPWALRAEVFYWGDLDSHGFAILDRLRHHAPAGTSVLMDRDTLDAWRTFAVPDPKPTRATPTHLTSDELATLETLTESGDLRLEQERIPWDWALSRLRPALHI